MPWTDRRSLDATKPYEAETRRRAATWPNNDEVRANGIRETNGASNAHDETPGTLTNPADTSGEKATDEDVVAPEVTEEHTTLGRACTAPSVGQLMPLRELYSQKTNERLDDRMVAGGRERELSNLMFTGCAVRDPEDRFASRHQDGSWQIR